MSETLLAEIEQQESRLKKKRLERLARDHLDKDMRERAERELLEKERRARFARERAELLSEKEGFSIRESCHIIGAGRSSVYEALNAGELTAVKLGRRTIILKQELLRFLSELPAANFGIEQPNALVDRSDSLNRPSVTPRKPRHVAGKAAQT